MTPVSPQIVEWRRRAALGLLTREEMREAVTLLRGERLMSVQRSTAPKAPKVKVTKAKDAKALLADFAAQMKLPIDQGENNAGN